MPQVHATQQEMQYSLDTLVTTQQEQGEAIQQGVIAQERMALALERIAASLQQIATSVQESVEMQRARLNTQFNTEQ